MGEDLTRNSDRLLADSRALLRDNQAGGRHRAVSPIGEGSRGLRKSNWATRLKLILASLVAILVASGVAGLVLNGIGFVGVMVTFLAMVAAVVVFGNYPKVKLPTRADLTRTQDARQLVARTELWLEQQRAALPAPAIRLVEDIGVQLDALGAQLAHVDPAHAAAGETRKLVGEVLPEVIDSYRHVTRQLAEGSLDDLAIRTRYLDYRYGGADSPETRAATPSLTDKT